MKVRWNLPNPTTLTSTTGGPSVDLKHGLNEVDDEVWAALMECESNRDHVRAGDLSDPEEDGLDDEPELPEVEPDADADEPEGEPEGDDEQGLYDHLENLDAYNVDASSEVIADTFSVETLNRWADADDRKGVATAIADQLALIEGAGG